MYTRSGPQCPLHLNTDSRQPPLGIVRSMTYKVALRKTDEGFSVSCPALPGCWSQGATEDQAIENIQFAIREYMDAVKDRFVEADVREVELSVQAVPRYQASHISRLFAHSRRLAF